jgi:tetratricopeptide (TPR) repeat protein
MLRKSFALAASLVLAIGFLAGCKKDPAKAKSEFMASAETYMAEERYSEAIIQYRNALKLEPSSSTIHSALAEAYFKNNQFREAFSSYKKAAELDPNNQKAQMALARFYLVTKQYEDVIQLTQAQIDRNPDDTEAIILNASAYAAKKDMAQATKVLNDMLAKHPDNVGGYMHLGIFLLSQKNIEGAREQFEKALKVDPKSIDARRAMAQYYIMKKDPAKAESEFKAAVDSNPESLPAIQALAEFYVGQHDIGKAEPLFQKMVTISKSNTKYRMVLGRFYHSNGKLEEAKSTYQGLATEKPDFLPAKFQLAEIAFLQGKPEEAERIANEVLKDRPKEPGALIVRARALLIRPGNAQKAIEDLEVAQKAESRLPMLHYLLGVAYAQMGNQQRAQSSFEEAIKIDENMVLAHLALAEQSLRRGQPDAAINYANNVLKIRPQQPDALLVLGTAYGAQGNTAKSQAALDEFARVAPNSAQGPLRLGMLALSRKQLDVAEKNFRRALEMNPKQNEAMESLVNVLLLQKKADKAEALIKERLAQEKSAFLYNLLGKLYAQTGRYEDAISNLNQARRIDPQNTTSLELLASVYMRQKSADKALLQYEQATKERPSDPGIWIMYGLLNEHVGKTDVARTAYEKALELQPNAGTAANNLAWIYAQEGKDMDRALDLARRAKIALPEAPMVSDTLAWIYYKRQLYDSALPLMQEAVKAAPENGKYRYHLAAILNGQGKKDLAKAEMSRALKLDAELRNTPEVKQLIAELAL